MEIAKYITVLDHSDGSIHQYKIGKTELEWIPENDDCEDFINKKGHHLSNCSWMVHGNPEIIKE